MHAQWKQYTLLKRAQKAIEENDSVDALKALLDQGLDSSSLVDKGTFKWGKGKVNESHSLLGWAAGYDRTGCMQVLLAKGADQERGVVNNALCDAVSSGHVRAVEILLDARKSSIQREGGNDSHTFDDGDISFNLIQAIEQKEYAIVKAFTDRGVKLDFMQLACTSRWGKRTGDCYNDLTMRNCNPLLSAAHNADTEMMRILRNAGANINDSEQYTGNTALHMAAEKVDVAAVRALLNAGADPDARNADDLTPYKVINTNNQILSDYCKIAFDDFDRLQRVWSDLHKLRSTLYSCFGLLDQQSPQPQSTEAQEARQVYQQLAQQHITWQSTMQQQAATRGRA